MGQRVVVLLSLGLLPSPVVAEEPVAGLVKQLETFKPGKQSARPDVAALVRIGPPAVPPLLAALDNPKARNLAALTLGRIGDRAAAPRLLKGVITGSEEDFVSACAGALAAIGDPSGVPELRAFLEKPRGKPVNLWEVVRLLGVFKDQASLAAITRQAKHRSQYVRGEVAQALGNLGDPAAAPTVRALAADKDQVVAGFALTSLGKLKLADARELLLEAFRGKDPTAGGDGLAYLGAHEPLYEALGGKAYRQREAALRGLAACGDDKAFDAVVAYLQRPDISGDDARNAAEGFVLARNQRAVAPLRRARDAFKTRKGYSSVVDLLNDALEKLETPISPR